MSEDETEKVRDWGKHVEDAIIHYNSTAPHEGLWDMVHGFVKLLECINYSQSRQEVLLYILLRMDKKGMLDKQEMNKVLTQSGIIGGDE